MNPQASNPVTTPSLNTQTATPRPVTQMPGTPNLTTAKSTTTPTTKTPRARSSIFWYAFVMGESTGKILSAKSQKDLKALLKEQGDGCQILSIIKGKAFATKVTRSFDFVDKTSQ